MNLYLLIKQGMATHSFQSRSDKCDGENPQQMHELVLNCGLTTAKENIYSDSELNDQSVLANTSRIEH